MGAAEVEPAARVEATAAVVLVGVKEGVVREVGKAVAAKEAVVREAGERVAAQVAEMVVVAMEVVARVVAAMGAGVKAGVAMVEEAMVVVV